jgi:hypothetical protein
VLRVRPVCVVNNDRTNVRTLNEVIAPLFLAEIGRQVGNVRRKKGEESRRDQTVELKRILCVPSGRGGVKLRFLPLTRIDHLASRSSFTGFFLHKSVLDAPASRQVVTVGLISEEGVYASDMAWSSLTERERIARRCQTQCGVGERSVVSSAEPPLFAPFSQRNSGVVPQSGRPS